MGKKRRGPTLEEVLARPWCYYCERDFDDLKILISHQKAKHFKCERCGRRLNTAGGLSVHMSQVHKEQLTAVDNALPNRSGLDVEIFGMEGVPEDVIQAHNQRVATQFQQAEAERQAVTGNPPPGTTAAGGQPAKKPKLESVSDLKKRLAEHKAKMAEARAGGSSGEATPVGAGQTPTMGGYAATSTAPAPATTTSQFSYPQPYGAPAATASPFQQSPQQTASPVYPTFSPGGQATAQYSPATAFSPQPYPTAVPGQPPYGGAPSPYPTQQPPPQTHTPPQPGGAFPPRSVGLPAAPGLPQRPAVGAPQVNAYQMQQMHMGHTIPPSTTMNGADKAPGAAEGAGFSGSVDDLISGAAKQVEAAAATPPTTTTTAGKPVESAEQKPKKDKSKARLVYSDNETSPEEKMARLSRYAYVPDQRGETVLEELPSAVVVGAIRESDTVVDATD
ncbi:putative C2H2 finger domain protein [Aspergillus saccharolyticus JOP 1030-1]|uniref:Putative C2H2 finger domain protein n=1 Tax=Aspergillus saccharolyticus JOP 1030-1 TaxID=1450539 RepID=A0A318Z828_9EURO|nr:putative C2H2 finger domain protein [Aspergillus saccharolyticus JOP 1030-1]PYH43289.1 putative C2H2 finger domain protein [Aspergillus saccharolyticus JOP 1030-1]